MALRPELTVLDKRVWEALPQHSAGHGKRASVVVDKVLVGRSWKFMSFGDKSDLVTGVLRGLEHLGLAENRRGYWRRGPESL